MWEYMKTNQKEAVAMTVIKRDGREAEFDVGRIERAIKLANKSVDKDKRMSDEVFVKVIDFIKEEIQGKERLTVEEIQDFVEKALMNKDCYDVAKSYILYREERTRVRFRKNQLMSAINEKLSASKVQNQNANVDEYSFGGRIGEADSELLRQIALDDYMSPKTRKNHLDNVIYQHDLDKWVVGEHNCLSVPFDDLLSKGFNTRQTDVRPANSVSTALQLVAVIFQLQSLQQFGGCSATHLDWTLIPYIRKSYYKHYCNICDILPFVKQPKIDNVEDVCIDDRVYRGRRWNFVKRYISSLARKFVEKEINQGVEGLYHNLNTLQSRSGNQLPFTSINYGTCTLTEGRMAIKSFLTNSIKGVGKFHKTPIFPCGIFQMMDGVNTKKGEPNYDLFKLALKSTAKRLYPNYVNVDWSVNEGYDRNDPKTYVSAMGCRTYNGWDINGFGQLKDGRGNIAPCTIILPTLAMKAKKASLRKSTDIVEEFMSILSKTIEEAKDSLIERFDWICSQSPKSAKFMWENNTMAGYIPEEGIRSAMKHGTLALGQIGLAETLQVLIGCDHTEPKGMELAKRIEGMFSEKCKEYKTRYKLNFGVYYSPAENLCRTSLQKFRNKYGVIPKVSDRDYFTNSMHIPVWKKVSPFEKIDLEAELTGYSSAGCITYVELDEDAINNIDALEQLVLYAKKKDIPYFAINVPSDTCNLCGYSGKLGEVCPVCGAKDEGENFSRLGRVTGYLTGDYRRAFNKGKQSEYLDRFKHSNKLVDWVKK